MAVQLDSGRGKKTLRPTINVTPLVDVVLVLLIIFMVVIPNMQEHKTITLFKTTHAEDDADEEKTALVVTMDSKGAYFIESAELPRDRLLSELARSHSEEPNRRVLLRADVQLQYGEVRGFFHAIKELGFDRVKLAVGSIQDGDLGAGMVANK